MAGDYHACALDTGGGVRCWGDNFRGQLGDGTSTNRETATPVSGLSSGVTAIAAGAFHTCAIKQDKTVVCWGRNDNGQLGNGTNLNSAVPVPVQALTQISALTAGGAFTCALTQAGSVSCWGYNDFGQLGDGTNIERATPVQVTGL